MKKTVKVFSVIAVIAVLFSACAENFNFPERPLAEESIIIPVENIIGIPTGSLPYLEIVLSGKVMPENATNKRIVWSLTGAGAGATLERNRLTVESENDVTVTVTAVIANGIAEGEDYTQNFNILISTRMVAVTNITGIPDSLPAGFFGDYKLEGKVSPSAALNKTILWSLKDAGTTGASIYGDILTIESPGTVHITATIANGRLGSDYTQDFAIVIVPKTLVSITAVYIPDPDNTIFTDTTHDTLKEGLTVTARYNDSTSKQLNAEDYTLSGELTVGESVITVIYTEGGVTETDTFTVTVNVTHVHNWSKISETAPTCTANGTEVWECTATPSHHEDREGAPMLGHDSGEWHITFAATCSASGERELRCTRDGYVLATEIIAINPDAHQWNNNYIVTTLATCSATGIETDTCSLDPEHTRNRAAAINPDAHLYSTFTTTATATAAGTETAVCQYNSSHTLSRNNVLIPMVFVEGGAFQLGKGVGAAGDTTPVSNVTVSGFFIGKYEVTQSQWLTVMGSNAEGGYGYGAGGNYPVYNVNWYEALVFCNKLSVTEGLTPAYRINNSTNPDSWGAVPTTNTAENKAAWGRR